MSKFLTCGKSQQKSVMPFQKPQKVWVKVPIECLIGILNENYGMICGVKITADLKHKHRKAGI